MKIISYVLTIIGTLIGGFQLFETMLFAESAPQQGAGAALALAWAVLPYCFARAVEKIGERPLDEILGWYFQRKTVDSGPPIPPGHAQFDLPPEDSRPLPSAPAKPSPQRKRNIFAP